MTFPNRVLLINQYFHPDLAATSQLLGDLARSLGSNGWEVSVVAGWGSYANAERNAGNSSGRLWNGVSVKRVWCTNFGRDSLAGRLCDYLTFLVSAAVAVALSPAPHVVVCLSTPPFVAVLGLIARLKGSRLVYKVEDLYPDVAVALSALRENSPLARLLQRLSRFLLNKADCVVALDEAMSERLEKAGALSIETIPNWADGTAIYPDGEAGRMFRTRHGLEGKFVILYSGNLGRAHRFDGVIEAAKQSVVALPDVLFLFVGAGPRLNEVRAATTGLTNVVFMAYQPKQTLNDLYNAADIHLVTLRDEVTGLIFPSKYPAALAAGKPVLLVGGHEAPLEREIRSSRLGWACPHQTSAVLDAIRDGMANAEKREAMGGRAREVFEACYSMTIAMQKWERLLHSVLKREKIANGGLLEVEAVAVAGNKKAASVRSR